MEKKQRRSSRGDAEIAKSAELSYDIFILILRNLI